ncbi:pyridoxal-phosphate dependent enzyme [bacterium]|nr:pyridoxal-phosphate dependent enzyme [bacterium]
MGKDGVALGTPPRGVSPNFWEHPTQSLPRENGFYNPVFLYGLSDVYAGRVPVSGQNPNLELQSPYPVLNKSTYSIYIVDEAHRIQTIKLTDDPDAFVRERINIFGDKFIGYEDSFSTTLVDNEGNHQTTQMRIYYVKGRGDPSDVVANEIFDLVDADDINMVSRLELLYLKSRFDTRPPAEKPPADFSRDAQLFAWSSVRGQTGGSAEAPAIITPVVQSPWLAQWIGAQTVYVKDEGLQNQRSFKVRGAFNFMDYMRLWEEVVPAETPVVAASHGNHAQGVIRASNLLGYQSALLVLPNDPQTQRKKIEACAANGAIVLLAGHGFPEAFETAQAMATDGVASQLALINAKGKPILYLPYNPGTWDETQARIDRATAEDQPVILYPGDTVPQWSEVKPLLVPTYDHPLTSVGQGTDAMELLAQEPSLIQGAFVYVVPFGGGGKLAGDGTYLTSINPDVRVVGVNDDKAPVFERSLSLGRLDVWPEEFEMAEDRNFADGTAVPNPGVYTFNQAMQIGAEAAIVTNDEVAEALVLMDSQPWYTANGESRARQIEGAGASAVAAMMNGAIGNMQGQRVVLSVSGSNIDQSTMDRAYALKGWILDDLDFYRGITLWRTALRIQENSGFHIALLNELIQTSTGRNEIRALLMSDGASWKEASSLDALRLETLDGFLDGKWKEVKAVVEKALGASDFVYIKENRSMMLNDPQVLARVMPQLFGFYKGQISASEMIEKLAFWYDVFMRRSPNAQADNTVDAELRPIEVDFDRKVQNPFPTLADEIYFRDLNRQQIEKRQAGFLDYYREVSGNAEATQEVFDQAYTQWNPFMAWASAELPVDDDLMRFSFLRSLQMNTEAHRVSFLNLEGAPDVQGNPINIYTEVHQPTGFSRGVVMLVPGGYETVAMYNQEIDRFVAEGYTVVAADVRGDGFSGKPLGVGGYMDSAGSTVHDLSRVLLYIQQDARLKDLPLVGYAYSRGGLLLTLLSQLHPKAFKAICLLAPALRLSEYSKKLLPENLPPGVSRDYFRRISRSIIVPGTDTPIDFMRFIPYQPQDWMARGFTVNYQLGNTSATVADAYLYSHALADDGHLSPTPVLVIHASNDHWTGNDDVVNGAREVYQHVTDLKVDGSHTVRWHADVMDAVILPAILRAFEEKPSPPPSGGGGGGVERGADGEVVVPTPVEAAKIGPGSLADLYEELGVKVDRNTPEYERYLALRRALAVRGDEVLLNRVNTIADTVRLYLRSTLVGDTEAKLILATVDAGLKADTQDLKEWHDKVSERGLLALAGLAVRVSEERKAAERLMLMAEEARAAEVREEERDRRPLEVK